MDIQNSTKLVKARAEKSDIKIEEKTALIKTTTIFLKVLYFMTCASKKYQILHERNTINCLHVYIAQSIIFYK